MSLSDDVSPDDALEVQVVAPGVKARGETFKDQTGNIFAKLNAKQFLGKPELRAALSPNEEPVTLWVRITDNTTQQLLQEGEALMAWVRVKQGDGRFVTKTALFSLGAIVAITITRRAMRHYKPR